MQTPRERLFTRGQKYRVLKDIESDIDSFEAGETVEFREAGYGV